MQQFAFSLVFLRLSQLILKIAFQRGSVHELDRRRERMELQHQFVPVLFVGLGALDVGVHVGLVEQVDFRVVVLFQCLCDSGRVWSAFDVGEELCGVSTALFDQVGESHLFVRQSVAQRLECELLRVFGNFGMAFQNRRYHLLIGRVLCSQVLLVHRDGGPHVHRNKIGADLHRHTEQFALRFVASLSRRIQFVEYFEQIGILNSVGDVSELLSQQMGFDIT